MRQWHPLLKLSLGLTMALHVNSCNSSALTFTFELNQPINILMTENLQQALDEPGRVLYRQAALHAGEALGAEVAFAVAPAAPALDTHNATVYLTLGDVDCTGDRAGYVRWRPNNILQVCPSMVHERSPLLVLSLVMHELVHVMGGNHVPCDGESLMAPDLNCPSDRYHRASGDPLTRLWYSPTDITEICQHTSGGICDR